MRFQISHSVCTCTSRMKIAELKDPLTALVSNLSQEIATKLSDFAARCRNYAMQNAEDPSFKRTLSSEGSSIPRPSLPQSKENTVSPGQNRSRPPPSVIRRDPQQAPIKKPRNAYNLFVASQSVKIKQQNPHMRAPDIVRIAAERYNNMTPEQKRPYIEKFEQAKRLYDEQQMDFGRSGAPARRGRGGRGARYDYTLK